MNISDILAKHKKWLNGEAGGERANLRSANLRSAYLSSANLRSADLSSANLRSANLRSANLRSANLRSANLRSANLSGANLSGANLSGANLSGADLSSADLSGAVLRNANLTPIRDDVWAVLSGAPAEVPGLLAALREGRVEGSTYEGECACLVGTLANGAGRGYTTLENVKPDASRPAERFFLLIRKGDTPETSEPCRIAEEWVNNWFTRIQAAFRS